MTYTSKRKIAVLGNYFPRKCGIASFTTELCESFQKQHNDNFEMLPVVMNDIIEGYDYPDNVKFEIFERSLADYKRAAEYINTSGAELLCLQHEYGIFGGKWGGYLLLLMRNIRIPMVTVLHTVLEEYVDTFQEKVFKEIISLSSTVIVMNKLAIDILVEQGVPREKIKYVPHGTPDFVFEDAGRYKKMFGYQDRTILLTFGLLRKCKGIEFMIKAMRRISRKYKDTLYIVAGETHPNVLRQQGDKYREKLVSMTKKYGLEDNILFIDRYFDPDELVKYLCASDFFILPYQVPRQIVSGTLSYAVAAGKAVVTTPMKCAEEYIEKDLVMQVPFNNYRRFAKVICNLMKNKEKYNELKKRAYAFGRNTTWNRVSGTFIEIFDSVDRDLAEYSV